MVKIGSSQNDRLTCRQLTLLAVVSLMSPVIRLLPKSAVILGGVASWMGPIFAVIPSVLFTLMLCSIMKARGHGEGLGEMILRIFGNYVGRAVLAVMWLWFIFYCGFILRSGGERLLSAVYESGEVWLFMAVTLAVALWIALKSITAAGRMGEVLMLVIFPVLAVIILFALPDVKLRDLWPVTVHDVPRGALSALPAVNICAGIFYFRFLGGHTAISEDERRTSIKGTLLLLASSLAVIVVTVGALSPALTTKVQNPFFIMIRSISVLGIIERIEAVVVALWVLTDIVYVSSLLRIGGEAFSCFTGLKKTGAVTVIMGAGAFACGIFMAKDAFALVRISERVVPVINMALSFGVLPAVYVTGKIRKLI